MRERILTRKAWAAIMRQCQDAIGLYNLDLTPTHLDGLRQGLAEHVFILMDVAFDGLVIYGGETIEQLLHEAREEITARGIRRTDTGGWRFPVKYRQSTPLSPDWIPSEHHFRPEATAALDAARQALQIAHDFIAWWFAPDEGN